MSAISSVQVGLAGNVVWVRVDGRGTFQNSAGLKEFAAEMTRRGHRDFVVDLATCELMDSTFLGTLTGVALGLRPDGKLTVVHANGVDLFFVTFDAVWRADIISEDPGLVGSAGTG